MVVQPGSWISPQQHASTARDFIATHSVFTANEFVAFSASRGRSVATARALLRHHLSTQRIHRVRRGLYASVPGANPWLIAAKAAADAVIIGPGALSFHRLTGIEHRVPLLVRAPEHFLPFTYNEVAYTASSPPRVPEHHLRASVEEHLLEDTVVRVTTPERAIVDCLHRRNLIDSVRLAIAFRDNINRLDIDAMLDWARLLGSRSTLARLGLFFEHNPRVRDPMRWRMHDALLSTEIFFDPPAEADDCSDAELEHDSYWRLAVPRAVLDALRRTT